MFFLRYERFVMRNDVIARIGPKKLVAGKIGKPAAVAGKIGFSNAPKKAC
jgi:hypothetical protein